MRVFVTDGDSRAALATVRSLGAAGFQVEVLSPRVPSLAGRSRFVAAEHAVPDAATDPAEWVARVEELLTADPAACLLPITEIACGTLQPTPWSSDARVWMPPPDAYARAVDKVGLVEVARTVGLDVPRTHAIEAGERLADLPEGFAYPVVMRARRSRWLSEGAWCEGGVRRVEDHAGLVEAGADPGFAAGALLQEFLPGRGEGVFLLSDHGESVACFAHRRLREKPPSGGVSVLCEAIQPDPDLLAGSQRLLRAIGWHGVAMVEFRRTPEGRAYLIEINPRLWGSLQLAVHAGVDFPRLLADVYTGRPPAPCSPRTGVRMRWLLGDLDHLWIALRRADMRAAVGRTRMGVIAAFLGDFFSGVRSDVFRRDDLGPFWHELRGWLA